MLGQGSQEWLHTSEVKGNFIHVRPTFGPGVLLFLFFGYIPSLMGSKCNVATLKKMTTASID
jgi:hypothetical protein